MPKKPSIIICTDFASPPAVGSECRAAVFSKGRSCAGCAVECYRQGWTQHRVTIDNAALVKANHERWKAERRANPDPKPEEV